MSPGDRQVAGDLLARARALLAATPPSTDAEVVAVAGRAVTVEIGSGVVDAVGEREESAACLRVCTDGLVAVSTMTGLPEFDDLAVNPGDDARDAVEDDVREHWRQARELVAVGAPIAVAATGAPRLGPGRGGPGTPAARPAPLDLAALVDAVTADARRCTELTGLTVHGTVELRLDRVVHARPGTVASADDAALDAALVLEGARRPDLQLDHHVTVTPGAAMLDDRELDVLTWWGRAQDADWCDLPDGPLQLLLCPAALRDALTPLVDRLSGQGAPPAAADGPVLAPGLVLRDEPRCALDDEGTPTHARTLVGGGVVVGAAHTLASAAAAGTAPTGNARRGTARRRILERPARPIVSGARLVAAPGGPPVLPWAELVAGVERGLVLWGLTGAGQAGRSAGRTHLHGRIRQALVVREGRMVGRCRPATVRADLRDVLVSAPLALGDAASAVTGGWAGRLPPLLTGPVALT